MRVLLIMAHKPSRLSAVIVMLLKTKPAIDGTSPTKYTQKGIDKQYREAKQCGCSERRSDPVHSPTAKRA
jgi:hypothetical protein